MPKRSVWTLRGLSEQKVLTAYVSKFLSQVPPDRTGRRSQGALSSFGGKNVTPNRVTSGRQDACGPR